MSPKKTPLVKLEVIRDSSTGCVTVAGICPRHMRKVEARAALSAGAAATALCPVNDPVPCGYQVGVIVTAHLRRDGCRVLRTFQLRPLPEVPEV
jgi:hypothetical protein